MTRTTRLLPLLTMVAALNACDPLTGPQDARLPPLEQLPRELSLQEREVIRASNAFAFDLLRETLREQPKKNVLLSPLSASLALGMTTNGARGETQDGMRRALGFGDVDMTTMNEAYRGLIDLLLGLDARVDMRIANSVWAREGFRFHESFFDTARRYFDAEVTTLDFSHAGAAPRINAWVKEKTGGRIEEIVANPLPPLAVMYLINAIYFKADWVHRFERAATTDAVFRHADATTSPVKMMRRMGKLEYAYDGATGAQVVELPYGRGAYAMTLVLPPAGADIDAFAMALTPTRWTAWLEALQEREVSLGLPRFRVEYKATLNEPLVALGMDLAFRRRPGTDFTGLSPDGLDLYISRVDQKTFIEVNEDGTEAAAATAVEIGLVSGPPEVTFDRPFLLGIRERLSGTLLFLGTIGEPQSR